MNAKRRFPVLLLAVAMMLLIAATGCSKKDSSTKTDPSTTTTSSSSSTSKPVSGSQVIDTAQKNQSTIEAGKSGGSTTSTPPQPIPQGTSADGQSLNAPQPQGDSYLVWEFDAVDLDGDDVEESGVAMLDASNTLYVWWTDISWWSGDELDGFLWLADNSAGFIMVLDDEVGLACAEVDSTNSASGFCIGCDDEGDCEEFSYTEVWTGGSN